MGCISKFPKVSPLREFYFPHFDKFFISRVVYFMSWNGDHQEARGGCAHICSAFFLLPAYFMYRSCEDVTASLWILVYTKIFQPGAICLRFYYYNRKSFNTI